ncbi:MAG TPA: D-2-hydroxyacid dehydrogenase [Ktedonobacteraceae bacterium]|nr:D-2-hydroxyacid dehydrogenase [Ktedonobacteraceae bacterium]
MSTELNVVSTFRFSEASQQMLSEAAGAPIVCVTGEELVTRLANADVLCSNDIPANLGQLARRPRWIQVPSAGVDALKPTGLLDAGSEIIITTASGIHATTICEYVFGSMLIFNWNWPQMMRLQSQHTWARSPSWYHLGRRELIGQTLGIVGVGSIGRQIAKLGHAFGMRVLGMRRSLPADELKDADVDAYYTQERLHDLLGQSDYVVLAVPLTPATEKLIGEAELRAMRANAYLVNIARGRVVDEQALIQALKEGWIAGAGLDVTEEEPLPPDSPLYGMQNVILTPHISGNSIHYEERLAELFAENMRRFRAGEELLNRYDAARGY